MMVGQEPIFQHASRRKPDSDAHILPLINVVFLLLIFFMLAGQIAVSDRFPVQPPYSESDGIAVAADVTILAGKDGRLAIDGRSVQLSEISGILAGYAAADGVRVRIKADADAEALIVIDLLEAVRTAGIERVDVLTQAGL